MATWSVRGGDTYSAGIDYQMNLSVTEQSTDTATNESIVAYKVWIDAIYSSFTTLTITAVLKLGNTTITKSKQVSAYWNKEPKTATICEDTVRIPHNADGTYGSLSITLNTSNSHSSGAYPPNFEIAGKSITLTNIPRKSSMSSANATIGGTQKFTITSASSAFYHSITAKIGSTNVGNVYAKGTSRTPSWTVPDLSGYMSSSASSVAVTYTLTTYPNSTGAAIGSTDYTYTISLAGKNTASAKTISVGTSLSVGVSKGYSSYKTTVQYNIGNSGWVTIGTAQSTGTSFSVATGTWGSYIPNDTSKTGTIRVHTYANSSSGFRSIGYNDYTLTLKVPDYSISASFTTAQLVNDNATIAGWGVAVKGYTKYKWAVSASTSYGATITSYSFVVGGQTKTSASGTTDVLNNTGSTTPTMVVKDSRGKSKTITSTAVFVYDYGIPVFSSYSAKRTDSGGTAKDDGTYLTTVISGSTAYTCGGHNAVTVSYRYKAVTAGSWTQGSSASGSGNWTISGFAITTAYQVEVKVTDSLGTARTVVISIPTAETAFNLKDGGKGAAFFGYAQTDGALEVYGGTNNAFRVLRPSGNIIGSFAGHSDTGQNVGLYVSSGGYSGLWHITSADNGNTGSWLLYTHADGDKVYVRKPTHINGALQVVGSVTIGNHAGAVGEYKANTGSVSVSSGTIGRSASLTLGAGMWVVTGSQHFPSNATGHRDAFLNNTDTFNNYAGQQQPAISGGSTYVCVTGVFSLNAETVIGLYCRQNSGSSLTCYGYMRAVRIA